MSQAGTDVSRPSQENVREQWGSQLDFLLSCLGYAVGLANVWRFPYLAYQSGGGAFLIPYTIMLFFVGLPIFVLELSLGQFTSSGPTACWDFCRLFQGCGGAMAIVSGLTSIYYNIIISWAVFFMVASLGSGVPWDRCGEWSTRLCNDRVHYVNLSECIRHHAKISKNNGTCTMPADHSEVWIYNRTLARAAGVRISFAAKEYFEREVTGSDFGNIANIGPMRWQLVICLTISWITVFFCLARGIKTSGKIVYVTATSPYLILTVLLIRGLNLDGAGDGILFYITPDLEVLKSARVWKDAAVQVFFSSASSYGGLIALASYNKFHNDVLRDSIFVSLGDAFTSIFAGFVIFSYLGFLAKNQGIDVDQVATQGPSLAFGVYPFSLTKLPATNWWSVTFFLMLLFLGLDSQFVLTETVITSLVDSLPWLRRFKWQTVLVVCVIMFFSGLPMTTNGGVDILDLLDNYAGGWNVLIISVCECIAVAWLYGTDRFLQDVSLMVGMQFCGCCKLHGICTKWWAFCWRYITPSLSGFVIIFSWVDYQRIERFPYWADFIGWAITFSGIFSIVGWGAYNAKKATGGVGFEKVRIVSRPNRYWGPALAQHRALVAQYNENIVINPFTDVENAVAKAETEADKRTETASIHTEVTEIIDEAGTVITVRESLV